MSFEISTSNYFAAFLDQGFQSESEHSSQQNTPTSSPQKTAYGSKSSSPVKSPRYLPCKKESLSKETSKGPINAFQSPSSRKSSSLSEVSPLTKNFSSLSATFSDAQRAYSNSAEETPATRRITEIEQDISPLPYGALTNSSSKVKDAADDFLDTYIQNTLSPTKKTQKVSRNLFQSSPSSSSCILSSKQPKKKHTSPKRKIRTPSEDSPKTKKQRTPEKAQRIFSPDLERPLQKLVQNQPGSKNKWLLEEISRSFENPIAPLKVNEVKEKPEAKTKKALQPPPSRQRPRTLTPITAETLTQFTEMPFLIKKGSAPPGKNQKVTIEVGEKIHYLHADSHGGPKHTKSSFSFYPSSKKSKTNPASYQKEKLIKFTENGHATFFPEFASYYNANLEAALREWFLRGASHEKRLIEYDRDIGADKGRATSFVEIYYGADTGSHIRPKTT